MSLHGKRKGIDTRRLQVRCLAVGCNQVLNKDNFPSHKARYHNDDDKVKFCYVTDSKQRKLSFTKSTSSTDGSSLDTGSPSNVTVGGLQLESRSASVVSGGTLQTGQVQESDTGMEDSGSGTLNIANTEEEAESSEASKTAEPAALLVSPSPTAAPTHPEKPAPFTDNRSQSSSFLEMERYNIHQGNLLLNHLFYIFI